MVRCGDSSSSEVWRYGVVVGAALAGVAEAGLAARDRERFSRGRACDGVFLDDGAMMAVRGHGFLVDGGLERERPPKGLRLVHLHKHARRCGPCARLSFLPSQLVGANPPSRPCRPSCIACSAFALALVYMFLSSCLLVLVAMARQIQEC
jgi:hypothetical protein